MGGCCGGGETGGQQIVQVFRTRELYAKADFSH
jgi:hypothetical protein